MQKSSSVDKLKDNIRLSVNYLRRSALTNCFQNCHEDVTHWKRYTWCLCIFVSSTFTDTHVERNYLMGTLLPQLRSNFRSHGIEIIFVDPFFRWIRGNRRRECSRVGVWVVGICSIYSLLASRISIAIPIH